jgi:cation transport ATPase
MKRLLFLSIFLLTHFGSIAQNKVKFIASGVTCSMCSKAIHKALSLDKSILKITPNLDTQEWELEYKEGQMTVDNLVVLRQRVKDAGFDIDKLWINGELAYEKKKTKKNNKKSHIH